MLLPVIGKVVQGLRFASCLVHRLLLLQALQQVSHQVLLHRLGHQSVGHRRRLVHHRFRHCRYQDLASLFQCRFHRRRFQFLFRKRRQYRHHRHPSLPLVEARYWMAGSECLAFHHHRYRYHRLGRLGRHPVQQHSQGRLQLVRHTFHHHRYQD